MRRTVYGRTLSAVGQNCIAARLAGIPVDRVIATAFVISSVLASLMGVMVLLQTSLLTEFRYD